MQNNHLDWQLFENRSLEEQPLNTLELFFLQRGYLVQTSDDKNIILLAPGEVNQQQIDQWSLQFNRQITIIISATKTLQITIEQMLFKYYYCLWLNENKNHDNIIESLCNHLMHIAILKQASDIHMEPQNSCTHIRMRIDGLLQPIFAISKNCGMAMTNRLKLLSQCDLAIQRLPQDGCLRFTNPINTRQDARINFCPTILGEKWVLRLLNQTSALSIHQLGLADKDKAELVNMISQPQGLILIAGPTGSGKTTTLYSILQQLNHEHVNIATIEDPVEKSITGANQLQVHHAIGFDFAKGLKALLRQDPDIIMIGEIRDYETAKTAMNAAQTGHLVLATIHSNSTIHTMSRLITMGFHPQQLAHTIIGIVAQRLVRKLCQHQDHHDSTCIHCHYGYAGRIGIYELLTVNSAIQQALAENNLSMENLLSTAKRSGLRSLYKQAIELVNNHITDKKEIHRVLLH